MARPRIRNLDEAKKREREARRAKVGLGKSLRAAHLAFNNFLRERLAEHSVTFSEFQHLQNLWREDGINQKELSQRIGITTASSTSVLSSLEGKKLIRRFKDKLDLRNTHVFLTEAGAALEDILEDYAVQANEKAVRGLTPVQIDQLYTLLATVTHNFEKGTRSLRAEA
jgi:DNA-binding MarR family transcriptional regulator